MLPLRKSKKLVERPENEPKANLNNPVDRKIILTMVGVTAVVLVLIVLVIIAFFNV